MTPPTVFVYGDMKFITSLPSPLHLRQLANAIYRAVMDEQGTLLDWSMSLAYSSGFLPWFWGWRYYPRERE